MSKLIASGGDWTFELLEKADRAIAEHAATLRLDTYPNQMEVVTSEQMLDAYASTGMPVLYPHWSWGKHFLSNERAYKLGTMGLAYEMVINSTPCISYLMEENTLALQVLVIAHACYGHNAFFKNNHLFRLWTQPDAILDYLVFARRYVMDCEERHGADEVEEILDACHALQNHAVDRYHRPSPLSPNAERARQKERMAHAERGYNPLWRSTVPQTAAKSAVSKPFPSEPQENLLYFVEKFSPCLEPWQRELVRIVRKISQYFFPQMHTKYMNEGYATYMHHTLLNMLYDAGQIGDGLMLEALHSHTNVVAQPAYDHPAYSGLNPYAIGFAVFKDIRRMAEAPTAEDYQWFPEIAGTKDWISIVNWAAANFQDGSFMLQFLSPKVMRDFHLFKLLDDRSEPYYTVRAIHDDGGYRTVRKALSDQMQRENRVPDIQVQRYDRDGDRSLTLCCTGYSERSLNGTSGLAVMRHLKRLWGFPVQIEVKNGDKIVQTFGA